MLQWVDVCSAPAGVPFSFVAAHPVLLFYRVLEFSLASLYFVRLICASLLHPERSDHAALNLKFEPRSSALFFIGPILCALSGFERVFFLVTSQQPRMERDERESGELSSKGKKSNCASAK
jgi:hypothetical protein